MLDSICQAEPNMSVANQKYCQLLRLKASDKAYQPITNQKLLIDSLVSYFEHAGEDNLLAEAYFYAGRVYYENVKNAGAVGLNIKYCYASETMIRIFHENDLLVSLWTANTIPQLLRTMSLAPDNITTKRPDLLKGLIYAFSQ